MTEQNLFEVYASLKNKLTGDIAEDLGLLHEILQGGLIFSTSFSYEDQLVTDVIVQSGIPVKIFTLDTGRLFAETYYTWNQTLEKYNIHIEAFYPPEKELRNFVTENGPNSFYNSVEFRKECCRLRKVVPLAQALSGNKVWITGLRAEHSPGRNELNVLEWDDSNGIIKYNPILHYTTEEVKEYISKNNVPFNPLHEKGFVSIGCAPCTRAIKPGEDFRAGRWWWEDASKKECGLHVHK